MSRIETALIGEDFNNGAAAPLGCTCREIPRDNGAMHTVVAANFEIRGEAAR